MSCDIGGQPMAPRLHSALEIVYVVPSSTVIKIDNILFILNIYMSTYFITNSEWLPTIIKTV